MNFYRALLGWLLLAALGALAWELLTPDLGEVLIRWHGTTVTTTVAFALVALALSVLLLWMLWALLSLPFNAWQRTAQRQARHRLINGLIALHEGRHVRAESLLTKAAEDGDARTVARLAAREAALRQGDLVAAAMQQAALTQSDPLPAALNTAEALLAQNKPQDVLDVLQPWVEKDALPPRGVVLRGEASIACGRAQDAIDALPALHREQSLSADAFAELERRWQCAWLRDAGHADELLYRWRAQPLQMHDLAQIAGAFAARAAELGLESEAAQALGDALEHQWDDALIDQFGRLPAGRDDQRLQRAEPWLSRQPANPALTLCLGRLCASQKMLGKAEELMHRAIAQGAGSPAWEALGNVFTEQNDSVRAQVCYANALRTARGESAMSLGGRSLREQIADAAMFELRNEHGVPHLRP